MCRKDTGEIIGVHLMGLHAADLIHESSNAMATKQRVQVGRLGGCMARSAYLAGLAAAVACSGWAAIVEVLYRMCYCY